MGRQANSCFRPKGILFILVVLRFPHELLIECSRFHQNCLEGVVNFSVLKVVSSGSDKFPSFLRHFLPPPCRSPMSYLVSGGPPRLLLGLSFFFYFSSLSSTLSLFVIFLGYWI